MNVDIKHFEHIIKAADDNSLAIFVGAGVSKSAENETTKLPTWSDLIEELKIDLGITYELDYLKVAQLYFLEFGPHTYYKKIKNYFPDNLVPSKIHELIFGINPHCVITTNWDCLLETSVLENAYIYDLVCSDQDLMKSSLDKKLIKMHGDFKNHNIVFKEDDYINYEFNFPLLSNYIKSILSTHTIIFIGYSYSDIDIKQIIKWAQNHTSIRPPMYLLVYENDVVQSRYLASHGVQTLMAGDYNGGGYSDYRTNKLYGFLKSVKDKKVSSSVDKSVINIVFAKLAELGTLNAILADQITSCLGECYIVYREVEHRQVALLKFYRNEVTQLQNAELREIYAKFKRIIKASDDTGEHKNLLGPIFDILQKADIAGVICDDEDKEAVLTRDMATIPVRKKAIEVFRFDYNNKFDFSKKNKSIMNLSFDKTDPYLFYQQCDFEMAYHAVDIIIKHELKHKNYASLLISLLNHNMILHILKNSFFHSRDNFSDSESYDINERFDNFPKNAKRSLSTLLDIVTVDYMFKFIHSVDKILTKNKDRENKKTFVYLDAEEYKTDFVHKNILYFIKENGCLVDNYSEFKYAINKIFEIKATKQKSQVNNDSILFSLEELYSAINYLETNSLKEKFKYKKRNKYLKLELDSESAEWLLNHAFKELSQFYREKKEVGNYHLESFKNALYLLAFSDECHNDKTLIYRELIGLVSGDYNQLDFIDC
ncbi:hypothetical protein JFZ73_004591, partial [Salmonella enterica]|nr:hypothetical protein [Salmonella enterica]